MILALFQNLIFCLVAICHRFFVCLFWALILIFLKKYIAFKSNIMITECQGAPLHLVLKVSASLSLPHSRPWCLQSEGPGSLLAQPLTDLCDLGQTAWPR